MDNLITIRTFNSSIDFEMVRSFLESYDIECFVKDEYINRAYLANVNGGVKLQVREQDVERAVEILTTAGYLKPEDLEPTPVIKWIDKLLQRFRHK